MVNRTSDTIDLLVCLAGKNDQHFNALFQHFKTHRASRSGQVIREATSYHPKLILLSSTLDDIEVRYVVHALKQQKSTKHSHILILSDDLTPDRLLEFYNSGADDVLRLDINSNELILKIDSILTRQKSNQDEHDASLSAASTATMSAINYASELGILIDAMVNISRSTEIEELAVNTLNSCEMLELNSCMQFRLKYHHLEFSNNEVIAELEKRLFDISRNSTQRIVQYERRLILNSPKFTLLIRNFPTHDPDRSGRYRDHLAMLVNITEARVYDIERSAALKNDRNTTTHKTLKSAEEELCRILELVKKNRNDSHLLINGLIVNIESEIMEMYMENEHEEKLLDLLETGRDKMTSFLDRCDTIDHCISNVTRKMYSIVNTYD